jgi:hypothetical protein
MKLIKPLLALAVGLATALPADAATRISVGVDGRSGALSISTDQGYRDRDGRGDRWDRRHRRCLDERTIERRLYRSGYVRAWDFSLRGDRYFARASTRRGLIFALVIDAYDGSILRAEVIRRDRGGRGDHGDYGGRGDHGDYGGRGDHGDYDGHGRRG